MAVPRDAAELVFWDGTELVPVDRAVVRAVDVGVDCGPILIIGSPLRNISHSEMSTRSLLALRERDFPFSLLSVAGRRLTLPPGRSPGLIELLELRLLAFFLCALPLE